MLERLLCYPGEQNRMRKSFSGCFLSSINDVDYCITNIQTITKIWKYPWNKYFLVKMLWRFRTNDLGSWFSQYQRGVWNVGIWDEDPRISSKRRKNNIQLLLSIQQDSVRRQGGQLSPIMEEWKSGDFWIVEYIIQWFHKWRWVFSSWIHFW